MIRGQPVLPVVVVVGFAMQRMYLILSILGWTWLAVTLVAWIVMTARQEAGRGRANGSEHEQ